MCFPSFLSRVLIPNKHTATQTLSLIALVYYKLFYILSSIQVSKIGIVIITAQMR
jgi:hypothetical protein